MQEITRVEQLKQVLDEVRCSGRSIGFVPTMGYLHQGHLALVGAAREESDLVVLSIYVNPAQFGADEDLDRYPRDQARDLRMAEAASVDIVFAPTDEEMYPGGLKNQCVWVDPGTLAESLCGASRPGHFRGVATVVAKLFSMVAPQRAYFGQKDAQQAIIVSRMVRDLGMPIEVRTLPTVREPDGLALSSRNVYLCDEERGQAAGLKASLDRALAAFRDGERDARSLKGTVLAHLLETAPVAGVDYVDVVDLETLTPIDGQIEGDALLALAVYFGQTRLIDNVVLRTV